MTRARDFKDRVRQRMRKTGERYTTARSRLLSQGSPQLTRSQYPGLLADYPAFGGQQGDVGLLSHALTHAGLGCPDGSALDETMAFGLCGGVGFLYAVFEYKGWPPLLTIVARASSMPDTFLEPAFERVGAEVHVHQTGGKKGAAVELDRVLESGRAAICSVDLVALPHWGMPRELKGMFPSVVGVVGQDGDHVWLDDRRPEPVRVERSSLDQARSNYSKAKHRLIAIEGLSTRSFLTGLRESLAATVQAFREAPYPSYASNFGLAGLEKWQRLLTHPKDKKGWPSLFSTPSKAYVGLRRVYDCVHHEYTAPAAGRALYADFLDRARSLLDWPRLGAIAETFRASGKAWGQLAESIASADDAALRQGCALSDTRAERFDSPSSSAKEIYELWHERQGLAEQCRLEGDEALALFASLADTLGTIVALETQAIDELEAVLEDAGDES